MDRLQKAADKELISAYYWRVIMDMSKKVPENIARKYNNVKEGVEKNHWRTCFGTQSELYRGRLLRNRPLMNELR